MISFMKDRKINMDDDRLKYLIENSFIYDITQTTYKEKYLK